MWTQQTGRHDWKRGPFFILRGLKGSAGVADMVDGMLLPPFGIYDRTVGETGKARMRNRWSLTHLPTGRCIAEAHEPWGLALVVLAEWISDEMPGVFDGLTEKQQPGELAEKVRRQCARLGVDFACGRA